MEKGVGEVWSEKGGTVYVISCPEASSKTTYCLDILHVV